MREVVRPSAAFNQELSEKKKWKWHEPARYSFSRGDRLLREAARQLPPAAWVLFFGLRERMGWENQVTDSLAMVGRACSLHRNTVTYALRMLEDARLIAVDRSNRKLLRITISPFLVWQGRPHLLYKAREVFEERCRHASRDHGATSAQQEETTSASPAPSLRLVPD